MSKEILEKLINNDCLSQSEINKFVNKIIRNELPNSTIGAIILGLSTKELNTKELTYLCEAIQNCSVNCDDNYNDAISCGGTGGDLQNTFNITTIATIVAATCGAKVVKKTNYGTNKKIGNAHFLKEIGIKICTTKDAKDEYNKNGIIFYNSEEYNIAEKTINSIRKELKINTIFNLTDALVQPIKTNKIFLGASCPQKAEQIITVLKNLNYKHAIVVNAQNPQLDEISICSETTVWELQNEEIEKYEITPDNFGIKRADVLSLRGATPKYNANLALDIFKSKIKDSKPDVVAMNAGAMLYLSGCARNYLEGIMKAYTAISKGLVLDKIDAIKEQTL